jgi:hypothetical protein
MGAATRRLLAQTTAGWNKKEKKSGIGVSESSLPVAVSNSDITQHCFISFKKSRLKMFYVSIEQNCPSNNTCTSNDLSKILKSYTLFIL